MVYVGYADLVEPDRLTVVEQGVKVAGRSTTRYSGLLPTYGKYLDLWVDDEFGLVLKSVTVNLKYYILSTFEITHLTFDEVTPDNICDLSQCTIDRSALEE